MTVAQLAGLDVDEAAQVLCWRYDELVRAGYAADAARVVAAKVEVDLHTACALAENGCPPEIALRILL